MSTSRPITERGRDYLAERNRMDNWLLSNAEHVDGSPVTHAMLARLRAADDSTSDGEQLVGEYRRLRQLYGAYLKANPEPAPRHRSIRDRWIQFERRSPAAAACLEVLYVVVMMAAIVGLAVGLAFVAFSHQQPGVLDA